MSVILRIVLFSFFLIWLTGCEILHNQPPIQKKYINNNPRPVAVSTELSPDTVKVKNKEYNYGKFLVRIKDDGSQDIFGGIYDPVGPIPIDSKAKHVIFINYTEKTLEYYRLGFFGYEPVIGYAVVTPSSETLPKTIVRGLVTKIDTKPSWCPTPNIRLKRPHLPKGCLPHGHPENAMGDAKFEIKWNVLGWDSIRLHDTKGYPEGDFWKTETFGCVRLESKAIKNLVALLGPDAVEEGIEIIVYSTISAE